MKAMIFAAGLGTRLKPLTDSRPKALIKYNEKPLIEHTIEYLIQYGVKDIIVNVHHFHDLMINYFETHQFKANISISNESDKLLDTGGGLKKAMSFFDDDQPFIIMNTDIITNLDLNKMIAFHFNNNNDITLAIRNKYRNRHLYFDENNLLCGKGNDEQNEYIYTRNTKVKNKYRFSGIHILNPSSLVTLPSKEIAFPILDWYLNICNELKIKGYDHSNDNWKDVGRISQLSS